MPLILADISPNSIVLQTFSILQGPVDLSRSAAVSLWSGLYFRASFFVKDLTVPSALLVFILINITRS